MKIVTVVGARPQFIKLAVVSKEIRKNNNEFIIHTGQHFDDNMSKIFFDELNISKPDYNLGISGGSHAEMTGRILIEIEKVLIDIKPNLILLYGDTNSTLSAALAAVKIHIPIAHIEAGNRLGTLENPEEVNRICTDHLSTIRFACTESALNFLKKENLINNSYYVGDPMYDAFLFYKEIAFEKYKNGKLKYFDIYNNKIDLPDKYIYLTCHRQENTNIDNNIKEILDAANSIGEKTIYPLHPRNKKKVLELNEKYKYSNVIFMNAIGYLESNYLINNCNKVITDSGGLQREAYFAKKQCVTVLDYVVWPETMINNCNQLVKPISFDIINKLNKECTFVNNDAFGDGHSAVKIANIIDSI